MTPKEEFHEDMSNLIKCFLDRLEHEIEKVIFNRSYMDDSYWHDRSIKMKNDFFDKWAPKDKE